MCHNSEQPGKAFFRLFCSLDLSSRIVPQCADMKIRKSVEIKARVDERTKAELSRLADIRELDVSDVLREAVRDLLQKQRATQEPSLAAR
jgi:hypothetical protein